MDGSLDFSLRRFPRLRSGFAQAVFLHRLAPGAAWADEVIRDPSEYEHPHAVEWASGACLAVRRSVLERLGGLDERFFLYSEDVDLCFRIGQTGHEVRFEPRAAAVHEGGASAPLARVLPVLAASRIRYATKHHGWATTALRRASVALGAGIRAVVVREPAVRQAHRRALAVALRPLPADSRSLLTSGDDS
jgi:GT2 family glycosyltransferase